MASERQVKDLAVEYLTGWGGHGDCFLDEDENSVQAVEEIKVGSGVGVNLYISDGTVMQVIFDSINQYVEEGVFPDPSTNPQGFWQQAPDGKIEWIQEG